MRIRRLTTTTKKSSELIEFKEMFEVLALVVQERQDMKK